MLFAVGLAAGMDILGGPVDVFGLVVLALLVNAASILWAAGVAMRLRTMQAGPAMQVPVFLVLFLAPVYVPLGLLQGSIQSVARVNPATWLIETGRGLQVAGEPTHVTLAFGAAFALTAVFVFWARTGFAAPSAQAEPSRRAAARPIPPV